MQDKDEIKDQDKRIWTLALQALYIERGKLDEEIAMLEKRLGRDGTSRARHRDAAPQKNRLSPAGRQAISMAMKKRWADRRALEAAKRAKAK